MQGSDFIFCIQDKDFNFWQVDATGMVFKSANPYFLDFAPSGWEDISISNVRNKNYWGIDRSVTIPLSYVNDGAHILKYIFYTLGIEESCYLVIASQQLDYDPVPPATFNFTAGGNPFTRNIDNAGTITGTPGETLYIKLTINSTDPTAFIDGDFGGNAPFINYFLNPSDTPLVVPVLIPSSGVVNTTFHFYDPVGTSTAGMQLVNADGSNTGTYGYWYKQIYRGEIDASEFVHFGSKVTCTTLEDGLAKYLKANEKTLYELPMNVPEAIWVKMDGINLHNILRYVDLSGVQIDAATYGRYFFGPCVYLGQEGDSTGLFYQSEDLENAPGTYAGRVASLNVLLTNADTKNITVTVSGHIEIMVDELDLFLLPSAFNVYLVRSTTDSLNEFSYPILQIPVLTLADRGKVFSNDYSYTFSLAPGESLFRTARFNNASEQATVIEFTENSKFDISVITRQDTTYIRALRLQYIFEQLISKFTEANYGAALSAFFQKYNDIVLTSGNAIRGLDDATMKISWADFFKFLDSFSSVGISEKNKIINLDAKENLIDAVNIIQLSEPAADSFKVSVAKEYLFNELQIGYPEIKNDVGVLNGNEEFNTKFIFSLGTTKSPGVLDKISPVKTSCYEIEKIRVTTLAKDTTDYKADNDNFALAIESTLQPAVDPVPAYYNLDRSLNASATGLIEPLTVFNIPLSPKRNLLRNGSFIRSSLYLSDTKTLKFISADKNDKMVAGGIIEKADVNIGDLDAKFFNPVIFEFSIPAPDNLLDMLDINPLQLFRFPFQGSTYLGLLQKVSMSPSTRSAQQYQLLSYASNDLTKLIDYYG